MTVPATDVVILGGTGFIGQRLTDRLRGQGSGGEGPERAPGWGRRVVSLSSGDCDLLNVDLTRQQLATVDDATALVVCSGISRLVGDTWSTFQANLSMVRNLLQAIDHTRPRTIIFLSSADVYGLPAVELPITETTLPRPTTYYGLAKLACERLFTLARGGSYPIACLRLPGIYGPTDGGRSVVGKFCRRLAAGQPIQLSGEGRVARDFVHVDDLCALIEQLVATPAECVLNVCTGTSLAMADVVECVVRQLDPPASSVSGLIESIPASADRDHDLTFDSRRLRELFPGVSFRELAAGIDHYVREMQQVN